MDERKLMRLGGVGAVLGGIVCFTPLVVTLLASLGLASWFGPVGMGRLRRGSLQVHNFIVASWIPHTPRIEV